MTVSGCCPRSPPSDVVPPVPSPAPATGGWCLLCGCPRDRDRRDRPDSSWARRRRCGAEVDVAPELVELRSTGQECGMRRVDGEPKHLDGSGEAFLGADRVAEFCRAAAE